MSDTIADRIAVVRDDIASAAARAGRRPQEVTLVAVTKTVPATQVAAAVAAGQLVFGENRIQEARGKIPMLGAGLTWHLLGHLQRNKARAAVELFDVVESLDSGILARDLDRRAAAAGKRLCVLIQVKEAGEAPKSGVAPPEAPALIAEVMELRHLELAGLMVLPPPPREPEDSRPHFARLHELRDVWDGRYCPRGTLRELSMGMSGDYEIAVEEGATIVRVGNALFGGREGGAGAG